MPLIKNIKENNCKIAIWKLSESLEELIKLSKDKVMLSAFKTTQRKKEILATRLLIHLFYPDTTVSYNEYGAPIIQNKNYISISHSKELVAIIISNKRVGIDIQQINTKAVRSAPKFIEKDVLRPISKEKATLIWCCKESIFKWYQKGSINFINDINIRPFIIKKQGEITANFRNKEYTLHYRKINTHFLVYVCI